MRKRVAPLLFGLVLILIGGLYVAEQFNLLNFNLNIHWFDLWPLFIIIPCLYNMIQYRVNTGNVIGLYIGALFLTDNLNFLPKGIDFFVLLISGIVIIIGISLVISAFSRNRLNKNINIGAFETNTVNNANNTNNQNNTNYNYSYSGTNDSSKKYNRNKNYQTSDTIVQTAIFWGCDINNESQNFQGGKLEAVFGGIDLRLISAKINHDITINASAVFGGVDLYLPSDVNVVVKRSVFLGGVDCNREGIANPNAPTVYVNANAVFGGVDIH